MTEQPDPGPNVTADPAAQARAVRPDVEGGVCYGALLQGRFELIECVGSGGMSTVYKAWDRIKPAFGTADRCIAVKILDRAVIRFLAPPTRAADRYIAVKVLNPRFQADPERLTALQREVECCQRLIHPNIVRVYEFRRDGPTAYITMEYLHGEPLTARIRSERFSGMNALEALPIVNTVGRALAYVHSRGIVHCDFKPANVFVTDSDEVKLIDFGVARAFVHREGAPTEADVALRPFEAISLAYASPQMLEGQEPDPRDDVYGLACTAYELLTGAHPFGYRSAIEARKAGLTVERRQGLSYRQWQALRGALAFHRAERTSSVKRFLTEFNEELSRVKPAHHAAGVAACLLVAIGGVIGLLSSRPEPGLVGPGEGSAGAVTESASDPGPATVSRAPSPRVAALLARAERQMAAKQLTTPVGDAALESYERVLELIPGHEGALEGIAHIKDTYKLWAQADKRRGHWKRAEASLKKALAIDPQDAMLRATLRDLRESPEASRGASGPRGPRTRVRQAMAGFP